MNIHNELEACMDCVQLIANGEVPHDWTDAQIEEWESRIEERWKDSETHAVIGGEEDTEAYFSWRPCGYCGSSLGGDRYPIALLCNHDECKGE